jgi:DNA replication initiation complex subunit (GINS family)
MTDHYSQLLELRRAEGAVRTLARIPTDFYPQTRAFLAELRTTFESELRENPSGRKGELARQTHQRSLQLARDLVEARMTKILSAAFQASLGGAREIPNALPEERALHEALVSLLKQYRHQAAPYLDGGTPPPPAATPSAPVAARSTSDEAGPTRASVDAFEPAVGRAAGERVVMILKDSPAVALGSETLTLRKDDVVSLPREVADLLVESRAAEPVNPSPRFASRLS